MEEKRIQASYWLFKKAYEKSEPDGIKDDIYFIRIMHEIGEGRFLSMGYPIWVTGYINELGMVARVGLALTDVEINGLERAFQETEKLLNDQVDQVLKQMAV